MLTSAVQNCSPDVTLVCGDVHLPASRLVLSASSTLLYSLLKEAPSSPIIISLPDTNHDQLHSLLTFLQTGQLKANKEHLDQVLVTAEYLQMTCFSGEKTESGKQTFSAISRNTDSVFSEVHPKKEESLNMPDEKTVEIINEEEYLKMRRRMVDTSLKKVFEQDGRTSLKCDICGKKWVGNVSKDRRRAVRHMGLHLQVRVRCSMCGVSLKSAEIFYIHKSKHCKNKSKSCEGSVDKDRKHKNGKVLAKEDSPKDDKRQAVISLGKMDKLSGKRIAESLGALIYDDKVQKFGQEREICISDNITTEIKQVVEGSKNEGCLENTEEDLYEDVVIDVSQEEDDQADSHKSKNFKCPLKCSTAFSRKSDLLIHLKNFHRFNQETLKKIIKINPQL